MSTMLDLLFQSIRNTWTLCFGKCSTLEFCDVTRTLLLSTLFVLTLPLIVIVAITLSFGWCFYAVYAYLVLAGATFIMVVMSHYKNNFDQVIATLTHMQYMEKRDAVLAA